MNNRNTEFENCKENVLQLMQEGYGRIKIAKRLDIHPSKAQRWMKKVVKQLTSSEHEALIESAKLSRSKQKLQDKNRIREKVLRESFRTENAVEEYSKKIIELLNSKDFSKLTISHNTSENKAVGIIHLSDIHFNELIDIDNVNKYNFNIASTRLKLLATRAIEYFGLYKINTVLIAMTGDMLNSDRRLDELLSMSTNRSNATFLAVDILNQFIMHINKHFNVKIAYVTGNESRIPKEVGWNKAVATDNYDSTIFNMLKYLFQGSKGVEFINGDTGELLISIGDVNILMIHGHGSIKKDVERSVEQIKGRYAARNKIIDYVIFGHLHSARIGDGYSRCSSLAGANAYSEENLNLSGRASQNLYIVHENKLIDGTKIDLQITDGEQYNIDTSLEAYNCKSESKTREKTKIFEIVI